MPKTDVQNTLLHMRSQWISIEGRDYQCDQEGIIRGIPLEDAKQLVERNSSPWRYVTERKPVSAPTPVAPALPSPPPASEPLPPPSTPEVVVPEAPPVEAVAVEAVEDPAGTEKIPGPGEEWPDPVSTMSMEYLHQMAHAYLVKFSGKISKAALIKKIKAAMYE